MCFVWGEGEGVSEEGGQAAQRGDGVSELKSGLGCIMCRLEFAGVKALEQDACRKRAVSWE